MRKLINLLFAVAVVPLAGLILTFAILPVQGSEIATQNLRATTVMVQGVDASGTGSVVRGRSGRLYVITNAHVCLVASEEGYLYATYEGGELLKAKIVKRNMTNDLCAARVEDSHPALELGEEPTIFSEVSTRGYPMRRLTESHGQVGGEILWDFEFSVGEIGSCPPGSTPEYGLNDVLGACRMHYRSTQTSLYGRPGSSGSPVVDENGKLVGVLSSWMPGQDYSAGMVPYDAVKRFLAAL